jgi:type IV secretion system protein VirD4
VSGVLRGIAGVVIYLGGLLFYGLRFLLYAVAWAALFGGAVYWASLKFSAPGSITRGLFDAIIVFISPIIAYTIIREKIRSLGGGARTHGSARFASGPELQSFAGPSGLLIGRNLQSGKPLRYDGPGHLLTIAPTRTGKGVGTVIPNLLLADRSVICVDPKGENTTITARARARFGAVFSIPLALPVSRPPASIPWPPSIRSAPIWPRMRPPWRTPWFLTRPVRPGKPIGTKRPRL